jgi:hypothetical protein
MTDQRNLKKLIDSIAVLKRFASGDVGNSSVGACRNFHNDTGFCLRNAFSSARLGDGSFGYLYDTVIKGFSHYSGNAAFPIDYRPGDSCSRAYYYKCFDKWDGEYGHLRMEFCQYLHDCLLRLSKAWYLDRLGSGRINPKLSYQGACHNVARIFGTGIRNSFYGDSSYYDAINSFYVYKGKTDCPTPEWPIGRPGDQPWSGSEGEVRKDWCLHMALKLHENVFSNPYK